MTEAEPTGFAGTVERPVVRRYVLAMATSDAGRHGRGQPTAEPPLVAIHIGD